jgi:hypothetical protein
MTTTESLFAPDESSGEVISRVGREVSGPTLSAQLPSSERSAARPKHRRAPRTKGKARRPEIGGEIDIGYNSRPVETIGPRRPGS